MKILIACEFSDTVRKAFEEKGHDAWSCDLLPTEGNTDKHIQGDVIDILWDNWDMMIAHPPCTHLAVSGARWFKEKKDLQRLALIFVGFLFEAPIPKKCIENPVSIISTHFRKPDQIIQPYMFGHGETKKTCLWLWDLPKLTPTNIVEGRENRIHRTAPGPNRWKERSRTYQGIANAMASQWS